MKDIQIPDPLINTYVLLLNTADIVSRYAEMELSKLGITYTQYVVLITLNACPQPPTLTELSERIFRTKNSLTTVIAHMEHNGLVKRVKDDLDRRAVRVMATAEGKELLGAVLPRSRELVNEVMSCYNQDEISCLSELLQRVRKHVLHNLAGSLDAGIAESPTEEKASEANI